VRFVIAGDGPGRAKIEGWIAELGLGDRVHLLGHRDDVASAIASLSMLVLPSYAHEGVPQIVLQAEAVGRAVVGTTIGGIPEVVSEGVTGLLVPPRDPEALATAIGSLLANASLRLDLGRNAGAVAAAHYGLDVMCRRLEAIYDRYLPAGAA
jgi:glycosyltransferase involved in cell wall biosynthesis